MGKAYEIQLKINGTNINGTFEFRIPVPETIVNADNETSTADETDDTYDAVGAMQFIVATILVYSMLSVFCTLIIRVRRFRGKNQETNHQDEDVHKYLKVEKSLKRTGDRSKQLYECGRLTDKVKLFEEKQTYLKLEHDMSYPDFTKPNGNTVKKKSDIDGTLSKMGASLFFFGNSFDNINTDTRHKPPSYEKALHIKTIAGHVAQGKHDGESIINISDESSLEDESDVEISLNNKHALCLNNNFDGAHSISDVNNCYNGADVTVNIDSNYLSDPIYHDSTSVCEVMQTDV